MKYIVIGSSVLLSVVILGSSYIITDAIKSSDQETEKQYESQIVWQYAYGWQGQYNIDSSCKKVSDDLDALQDLGWKIVSTMPAEVPATGGKCFGREILIRRPLTNDGTTLSKTETRELPEVQEIPEAQDLPDAREILANPN